MGQQAAAGIGRFEVEREVGRGATGIVFRALDREAGAPVALKLIASADADAAERERFLEEGRVLRALEHDAIVRIVDFGTLGPDAVTLAGHRFERETPYIAMEWLSGKDLERRHGERPLELPQALDCTRQVAGALAMAHDAGVIHRDVKPSNVFVLDGEGPLRCKLVDFGVACADRERLGSLGAFVGTPAYMAPEQARGDALLDDRCDVYSLGATLFELVTGRPPHVGPTPIATLAKLVSTPAQRLSELVHDLPEPLDDLVADMLQMEAASRPPTREIERRLAELCADPRMPRVACAMERHESAQSSTSRLITTVVALGVPGGERRRDELGRLREAGAEAVALGRDGVVAFLGARRAHGGEAARAVELGKVLAQLGAQVGVATGRALVDLARPVGEVVDHASALARAARTGQTLSDETTAELARSGFVFVRGGGGQWVVGAAVPERAAVKELTPFVGRAPEIEQAFAAFDGCVTRRQPVVVSVSGPPGIGKSRLARELLLHIDERPRQGAPITERSEGIASAARRAAGQAGPPPSEQPVRIAQTRCEAYGRARALGMAADTLVELLSLPKGARRAEVAGALERYELAHDEGGLLASLLAAEPFGADVAPQRARDILYLAMTELVLKATRDRPTVIVLEDVQWSDPESVAWFDHLLSRAAGRALLLLVLARPAFWRDHPQRFAGREHVRIELRPIARRATVEIARAIMGCPLGDPKLDEVAQQAAGSPLFAEELARVIAAGKPVSAVPTIEAAIQVSLDALEPAARDTLVRMSVFGMAAWDRGLEALGVARPLEALARLVEAELAIEQRVSRYPGAREFRFKHALVRDVAHASASEAMRAELHTRAAAWLAEAGGDAATVAEHYDLGAEHARAARYWELAARRALAAHALADAARMADRALTFAEDDPTAFARASLLDEVYSLLDERASERLDAIEAMASHAHDEASEVRTMGARARYDHARSAGDDVEERLIEVVERATSLGMLDEAARCQATVATRWAYAGDLAQAEKGAAHLLALAGERGVQPAAVDAWQVLAVVHQTRGELAAALEARRNAARAARAAGLKQREATLTINLGFALTTIGARDEARRELAEGIRMAEEIGSAGTVRLGRMLLLGWAAHFGADPSLDEDLGEPRASADEAATGGWIVKDRVTLGVLFYRGCELLHGGDPAAVRRARALLQISAEAYRATDNRDVLPVALGYWAEALRRLGQTDVAARIATEAAALVEAGAPSLLNEAVIYLALHGALVDAGDLAGARATVERAMPLLVRRVRGLRGTAYERAFLKLSHNAALLAAADTHGCVPDEIERLLEA
jgi:tetratricopeptide (TPR) repeat protein